MLKNNTRRSKKIARKNARGVTQKAFKMLPKLIVLILAAGVVGWLVTMITGFVVGLFTGIGVLGVTIISVSLNLVIFLFAIGMNGIKIIDLVPIIIVAPMVAAILSAMNIALPIVGEGITFGGLALTFVSVILANSLLKQTGIKMFK